MLRHFKCRLVEVIEDKPSNYTTFDSLIERDALLFCTSAPSLLRVYYSCDIVNSFALYMYMNTVRTVSLNQRDSYLVNVRWHKHNYIIYNLEESTKSNIIQYTSN